MERSLIGETLCQLVQDRSLADATLTEQDQCVRLGLAQDASGFAQDVGPTHEGLGAANRITSDVGVDGVEPSSPKAVLMSAFQSGDARLVKGTPEEFQRFFGYFDTLNDDPIALTIR